MMYVFVFLAGVNFGALIGAAATRYRIRQRQAAHDPYAAPHGWVE